MIYPIIAGDPTAMYKASAGPELRPRHMRIQAESGTVATIEFSDEARARLLKSQGQSIAQIAVRLRLDMNIVSSFFFADR
jgi:hypothetical protein